MPTICINSSDSWKKVAAAMRFVAMDSFRNHWLWHILWRIMIRKGISNPLIALGCQNIGINGFNDILCNINAVIEPGIFPFTGRGFEKQNVDCLLHWIGNSHIEDGFFNTRGSGSLGAISNSHKCSELEINQPHCD